MINPVESTVVKGLEGVVVAESDLSHVDGLNGELIIRGYDVRELAGRTTYEEVAHLLWRGHLPNQTELSELCDKLAWDRPLPYQVLSLIDGIVNKIGMEPMGALRTAVSALALDASSHPDDRSPEAEYHRAIHIVARMPTIVAAYDRIRKGLYPVEPRPDLSHAANFLWMLNGEEPDPLLAHALDTYLVCVSDHGMNASTFTARIVVSTRSDMYSAVTAAVGSLKGLLHGGAPSAVLEMFEVVGSPENAENWVRGELAEGRRLMGIGHRVYKVRDPRAEILASMSERVAAHTGRWSTFELARELERVAVNVLQEVKPGRQLYANVEFYTATLLDLLDIPRDLFTAIFAVGRSAGWTAHAMAQLANNRLIRPRSHYVGAAGLKWVPIEQR
jgi:citrate synthase